MSDAVSDDAREELDAAIELWEHIAAYAWDQYITFGNGVVLAEKAGLLAGRDALRAAEVPQLALGYVPLTEIPPGDDFRALLRTVDPHRQVALLVKRFDDSDRADAEQLYVLEMLEGRRDPPEECYFARERRRREG